MCPRVASIGKCRAPRVNDDTLSARHCTTEFIYSIYPGTKVCGSSAGHRSLQWPASCSKPAAPASLTRAISTVWDRITSHALRFPLPLRDRITSLALRFPFPSHGLSYERTQKCVRLSPNCFFRMSLSLTRASSRRSSTIRKKRNHQVALLHSFVIRTGFEPVTHSLEGCCSIQLSYRTSPIEGANIVVLR